MSVFIDELGDFFERRRRFAICDDYLGMEASRIPEAFVEYFKGLSVAEQKQMTAVIVAAALGEIAALVPRLDLAASLLLNLCLRGHTQHLASERESLEGEFNKPENLDAWCEAGDEESAGGLDHKAGWRYGLKLWGVLYLLKSDRIASSYDYLLEHADSPRFRSALVTARALYDSGAIEPPASET